MSFTHPELLLILLVVPLLLLRPASRMALRFPDLRMLAGLPHGRARRAVIGSAMLKLLALVLLIIAAAGPRLPDEKTRIETEGIAVMVVLDVSGSMDAPTFTWQPDSAPIPRQEAARRALRLFIEGGDDGFGQTLPGRSGPEGTDAIGLVTFTNWPQPISPPTLNHRVLLHLLDDRRPRSIREEGSNIGDAIALGLSSLERSPLPRRVMILISDGELNYPDQLDPNRKPLKPRQAAQLAANLGVPIYVIDTGGTVPEQDRKQRDEARAINDAVARLTQGRVFEANDGSQLLQVCREVDAMERRTIASNAFRRYRELYPWLAGAGLTLVLLVIVLEQTCWRRLP